MNTHPILVTGIERSGSSIIARILGMCGAFTGPVTEMQENRQIKLIVDSFYRQNKWDPRGQFPLPNKPEDVFAQDTFSLRNELDNYVFKNVDDSVQWMYKSSRIAQTWWVWNDQFPTAKWIIVRRRTGDIIQSCIKTGFMTAFAYQCNLQKISAQNEADGWLWWVHEHEKMFSDMIEAGIQYKEVWPERMAVGDFEQIKELVEWLGLTWNEKVVDLVSSLLKNSKQKERT